MCILRYPKQIEGCTSMKKKKQNLYRTTAEKALKRGYLDHNNEQLHYAVAGNGPALLFIHQSSSSMEEYAALAPYFSADHQLILFDLPGHGMSSDPEHEPGVPEFTKAALAVLEHLQIPETSIVGHHGGALIAMDFAYKYPERTHKLVLSGTSGIKTEEEKEAFSENLERKNNVALDRGGEALLLAWQRYANYMEDASLTDILRPFLNSVLSRLRPYDAHHAVLKWDRQVALKSLDMPILLLQGSQDEFVSKQENLLDIIPNATRKVIENAGAFAFFDKAEESSRIIHEFLNTDV